MALSNSINPTFDAMGFKAVELTPDDSATVLNVIPALTRSVSLGANVNDANDFTVLPSLADVPTGHVITIIAGSAANSELRTPAASAEEINSEDCDGTKELLMTATNVYTLTKIDSTIGWMCKSFTAVGTVVASVTPD